MSLCGDSSTAELPLFQGGDGGAIPTSPLQLFVREVNNITATNFYRQWHYLGETQFISTINFGAFYDNYCRGVISFGAPNAKKMRGFYDENTQHGWWEIKRLAMDDACPKNSESRFIAVSIKLLLKIFRVRGLVTMADSSIGHRGIIYKATGFKYLGLTAKKADYLLKGKKIQRGKVRGLGGSWVDRPQKHLYVMEIEQSNSMSNDKKIKQSLDEPNIEPKEIL